MELTSGLFRNMLTCTLLDSEYDSGCGDGLSLEYSPYTFPAFHIDLKIAMCSYSTVVMVKQSGAPSSGQSGIPFKQKTF